MLALFVLRMDGLHFWPVGQQLTGLMFALRLLACVCFGVKMTPSRSLYLFLIFICHDFVAVPIHYAKLFCFVGGMLFLQTVGVAQISFAPELSISQGAFANGYPSHLVLMAGGRGSFYKERWRDELMVHVGAVSQGFPEVLEGEPPFQILHKQGDYLRFGALYARDYALTLAHQRLRPYVGLGAGLTWYSFERESFNVDPSGGAPMRISPPTDELTGSLIVSGRLGLDYLYTPALNFFAQYAYYRQGDPAEDSLVAQWVFASHGLRLGVVYHFSLPRKFKTEDSLDH